MEAQLISILLDPEIIALSAGIVAVLHFIGLVPVGEGILANHPKWRRVLPLLPLVLGIGGAFLLRTVGSVDTMDGTGANPIQTPILAGCWAGFVAAHSRKILKRLVVDKLESAVERRDSQSS